MPSIGFILSENPSEELIERIRLISPGNNVSLFFTNHSPVITSLGLPMFPFSCLGYFGGTLIATDLNSASRALKTNNKDIMFFVMDLEWIGGKEKFSYYHSIYGSEKIKLIARDESHANLLKKYFSGNIVKISEKIL